MIAAAGAGLLLSWTLSRMDHVSLSAARLEPAVLEREARTIPIVPPEGTRISRLLVRSGQSLVEGQPIAHLDQQARLLRIQELQRRAQALRHAILCIGQGPARQPVTNAIPYRFPTRPAILDQTHMTSCQRLQLAFWKDAREALAVVKEEATRSALLSRAISLLILDGVEPDGSVRAKTRLASTLGLALERHRAMESTRRRVARALSREQAALRRQRKYLFALNAIYLGVQERLKSERASLRDPFLRAPAPGRVLIAIGATAQPSENIVRGALADTQPDCQTDLISTHAGNLAPPDAYSGDGTTLASRPAGDRRRTSAAVLPPATAVSGRAECHSRARLEAAETRAPSTSLAPAALQIELAPRYRLVMAADTTRRSGNSDMRPVEQVTILPLHDAETRNQGNAGKAADDGLADPIVVKPVPDPQIAGLGMGGGMAPIILSILPDPHERSRLDALAVAAGPDHVTRGRVRASLAAPPLPTPQAVLMALRMQIARRPDPSRQWPTISWRRRHD